MATNQINVGINVSSNGTTDKETKKAKGLKDMLDQTAISAARAGRAMAASRSGAAGGGMGGGGTPGSAEVMEYGRSRAIGVGTGASARDFANQAQGLGGLVRIYATLAANIFAATAAFSALSRAMDTTNMIQGLDQLGAASGSALGSLSKRLFESVDGAVSLREAMEATVKASSAGLNTDQILQLGQVSKNASQALGVNMTDALSRLSRGITKLEPELLDELGIFVRIDDAVSKYALGVGKTTSSLTDFERRQAFANAVLEQGSKKFGEIDIPVNSYTKLAAALQNLAQTGLEFVNKFLGPVARILAENSGLLTAAIAVLGAKLVGMAIPALGQWRQGLVASAKQARESATQISESFGASWVDRMEKTLKLPDLRAEVSRAQTELSKLGPPKGLSTAYQNYFNLVKSGTQLESGQVGAVTKLIGDKQKAIDSLGTSQSKQARQARADYQAQIAQLKALKAANDALKAASGPEAAMETAAGRKPSILRDPGAWMRETVSRRSAEKAISTEALSRVSGDTLEKGFVGAMKNLNKELVDNKIGVIRRFTTLAVGSLAAATTTVGLFASAVQGYVAAVAMIGGAVFAALKYFSNTKKEAELTGDAMDRMSGAIKSATLTMERYSLMKDPLAAISVEAINARATALLELGDAMQQGLSRALQELDRQNWAAKVLDWFSSLWDGDVKSKLAENVADSLTRAFEVAQPTASTKAAREKIEGILGTAISDTGVPSIIEGLIKSGDTQKVKQITDLIKTLGDEQKASASKATELRESMSKVTKTIQEFNRNLKPKDSLYDIATDGTDAIIKLNRALQDPVQSLNAMRDVATNLDLLTVFPQQVALNLQSYGTELKNLTAELGTSQQVLQVYDDQIASINSQMEAIRSGDMGTAGSAAEAAASEQLTKLQNQIDELQKSKNIRLDIVFGLKNKEGEIKAVFDRAVGDGMLYNAELAAQRLNKEFVAARGIIGKYIADRLSGTMLGIEVQADLEKQRIDAEFSNTQAMYNLSLTMDKLRIVGEKQLLQETRKTLEGERAKAVASASTGGAPEDAERRALQAGVSFDQKLGELDRRMEALGRSEDFITRIRSGDIKGVPTAKDVIEGTRRPMEFRGTGGQIDVSQIDPGMLENIRRYEEFRLQQFKKTQEQKLVELKKQNEIEDLTFKRQQEIISREQEKLDKTRQTVGLLTQASGLNSKILSNLDSQLAREQLNLDLQKQMNELERDEANYRKNVDELLNKGTRLSSEELKKKSAAVAKDGEALRLRRTALETSGNQQAVIQLIKDAEKEVTRELEKQAKARERQLALQQLENEKSDASRTLNKTRLGIVKETGVLSNTNIAIQENALELADRLASQEEKRREELNNQTKELQPFKDAIKGLQGTLSAIDTLTPSFRESIDPRAIEALKAAIKENEVEEQKINDHYKERNNLIKARFDLENQSAQLRAKDALIVAKFADSERERLKQVENIGLKRQAEDVGLDFDIQRLDLLKSQDQITQDVYDQTMRGFQQIKRERELENRELEITNKYTAERLRLQNELNRAEAAGNGWVDVGTASRVQKEMDDLTTREALERGIIDRTRQGYRLLDAETKNLTERQRGYEEAFKNSFENMADAMVEFAKTGKFEFKEMVNSLIADLLRLEYKMQMQELYKAVRPGIGNFFSNLLGSSSLPGAGPTAFVGPQAKGGVFENMNYFAKGGAFTNSIVDNPTIFRFAKGVGMMGEAGPEAIMPLKRDGQGNLGVRADGSKTEVVVNNYSGQQANAREVTDSRGNRRIEVTIGDMVAGEMSRSGSATQKSVRGAFGLQPQLIRR